MSAFSNFLSTNLFSGTYLTPAVQEIEGSLQTELNRHFTKQNGLEKGSSATIRFTMEPDHKLVLLDVVGKEELTNRQISNSLNDYQVKAEGAQPFVVYQMDLTIN